MPTLAFYCNKMDLDQLMNIFCTLFEVCLFKICVCQWKNVFLKVMKCIHIHGDLKNTDCF